MRKGVGIDIGNAYSIFLLQSKKTFVQTISFAYNEYETGYKFA